jgi:hypothetical protein
MEDGAMTSAVHRRGFYALCLVAVVIAALWPETAFAWGAGLHVAQGSYLLESLSLIRPEIAGILAAFPNDYIYGCVSADIFIGKGYKRRDDHCHNWSVGMRVLELAENDSTRAYAYGYLTHLAADVVAHNHLIPNLLYQTPTSRTIGHVFWEFRADRFIRKSFWRLASEVVSLHNHDNDTLIKKVMNRSQLRFGAKKALFRRAVALRDIIAWRQAVEGPVFEGFRILSRAHVSTFNNYSINLIVDLFRNWEDSVCLRYDPVGTDNTVHAKFLRKSEGSALRLNGESLKFPVPDDIVALDYVDHKTERM